MARMPDHRDAAGAAQRSSLPLRRAASEAPLERRLLLRSLEVLAYWMPVCVALLVLAQFGTRGLKPALIEEQRLAAHEAALEERRAKLLQRRDELEALREAHEDPIYQERLRRAALEGR